MKKSFLILIILLLSNIYSVPAHSVDISSKVCNATTKVCVSNITNTLTEKNEDLLNACKQCCSAPQLISLKGCAGRCQKSCEKAYQKAISKQGHH